MEKLEKIYEGKAKIIYSTDDPGLVIQYFKDDASAFNRKKLGTIGDKGVMNNAVSSRIFQYLEEHGVKTHFVEMLSEREMLVRRVAIVPVEVIVRNRIAGSMARRLGLKEGDPMEKTVLEFCYKSDDLDDPLINEDHIEALGWATVAEIKKMKDMAYAVNGQMKEFFAGVGIELVDFKLEFGRFDGEIILADEISPDSCRLWDMKTGEKMDKDRFRFDLGKVEEAYQEVLRRVSGK